MNTSASSPSSIMNSFLFIAVTIAAGLSSSLPLLRTGCEVVMALSGDEGGASECPTASLPSCASTLHDLDAREAPGDWALEVTAGESYPGLVTEDHCPPEAERTSAVAETSSAVAGTIGILCGNWGGNKKACRLMQHMHYDLKSGPCTFILLQEATAQELINLKAPGTPGEVEEGPPRGGGGKHWLRRQSFQYLGLGGKKPSRRHDCQPREPCRVHADALLPATARRIFQN